MKISDYQKIEFNDIDEKFEFMSKLESLSFKFKLAKVTRYAAELDSNLLVLKTKNSCFITTGLYQKLVLNNLV